MPNRRKPSSSIVENINCASCGIMKQAWCATIGPAVFSGIQLSKTTRLVQGKETVYHQDTPNDGVYCLVSGLVLLSVSDSRGETTVVRTVTAGDIFGCRSLLSSDYHAVTATTLDTCVICHISKPNAKKLLVQHPSLAKVFVQQLAKNNRSANEALLRAPTMGVRQRMIHFLLVVLKNYANYSADGTIRIALPVNKRELSEMIGSVPETVSRKLKMFRAEGSLVFENNHIVILKPDELYSEIEEWADDPMGVDDFHQKSA